MFYRKQLWTMIHAMVLGAGCGEIVRTQPDAMADVPDVDASVDAASPPDAKVIAPPSTITIAAGGMTGLYGVSGTESVDACPSGQALTGFQGATGSYRGTTIISIQQIAARCSTIRVGPGTGETYTTTATAGATLATHGTATDTLWTTDCPSGQFAVGVSGHTGATVDKIQLNCAPLALNHSDTGWVSQIGDVTVLEPVGGNGGGQTMQLCATDQIVTTARVYVEAAAGAISGLAFDCSVIAAQ